MFYPNDEARENVLHFVNQAMNVASYDDYRDLLKVELRRLLPFEIAICGFGYITANQTVQAHKLFSVDFPVDYLRAITAPDGGFTSPKMADWMQTREPQLFVDDEASVAALPAEWVSVVRRFGLKNVLSHGIHDLQGGCTSYFCFGNLAVRPDDYHCDVISIAVPILHSVLLKIVDEIPFLGVEPALGRERVTARELELLQWVAQGRQQKIIAAELGLSVNTVRNTLQRAYAKLGVTRNIDAIERAKALGLI